MRSVLIALSVVLVTFLGLRPGWAQESDIARIIEATRGITVSGTAEVRAAPDTAYVTAGVRTRDKDAGRAASQNAATMGRVMQSIRRTGIAEKDVETIQYTLQPVYEYPPNASPRQVGFEATNLVRVTVRDMNKVGQVIDAVEPAGANVVQDVAFGLQDESAARVRSQALSKAVDDARSKASVMSKALGVRLGKLISANESAPSIIGPMMSRAEATMAAPTPISPQQVVVRATVNLVYAIQQ
jgi:uncharacterized protein YggE